MSFLELTSYGWVIMFLYWLYAALQTKTTVRREAGARRIIYLILVISAFALVYSRYFNKGFLSAKIFNPVVYTEYAGLILCIASIVFAIVARWWLGKNWSGTVTVKKDHELIQTGPYRITRHPIYTGIFMGLTGAALIQAEIKDIIALVLLFTGLHIKMIKEEKFMAETFPAYKEYAEKTKRLIPFIY
jgi:protein-S-isoprenylcysteine O-methyltransferase Ste14